MNFLAILDAAIARGQRRLKQQPVRRTPRPAAATEADLSRWDDGTPVLPDHRAILPGHTVPPIIPWSER